MQTNCFRFSYKFVVSKGLLFFGSTEHFSCSCYFCHRKHMILHTIMDRGDNYKYINGELKVDEFEEKGSPYWFYEEWLKNTTCLKNFCLKKIMYKYM